MSDAESTRSGPTTVENLADARSETDEMAQVVDRLRPRLTHLPSADLEAQVRTAWAKFAGARVRTYVPILVERDVRRAAATA